jgi:hypothetical protein
MRSKEKVNKMSSLRTELSEPDFDSYHNVETVIESSVKP